MKKIAVFWLICLFSLVVAGCSFSFSGEDSSDGTGNLVHRICGSSDLLTESSRNAFPTYQKKNMFFNFYAVKNSDKTIAKESCGAENSFSFELANGEWIIFCDVYYGSSLNSGNFKDGAGTKIFSGSKQLLLDETSGDKTDLKITTKIYTSENAKGRANLRLYSAVNAVKSAKAEWTGSGGNSFSQVLDFQDSSKKDGSGYFDTFDFGGNSVPAGVYRVKITFYGGAVSGGEPSGNKICVTIKTVNIASSLTTDFWSDDGSFVKDGSGKFVFSENCIKISRATALYVSGNAAENGAGILPSEPMNSLDSAFDLLFNFSMDNVPVCILEGTTASFSRTVTLSEAVKNLTVTTYKADGTIYGERDVVLPQNERGTIKRAVNLVQILDGGTDGATINFVNVNITGNDSADVTTVNSFVGIAGADVSAANCKVRDDFFLYSNGGNSGSVSLYNVDFSFSGNTASLSTKAVFVGGGNYELNIDNCVFKDFTKPLWLESSGVNAVIKNSEFSNNSIAIKAKKFNSLLLSGVTIKDNSEFGIKANGTFTLSGTCTFDDTFNLDDSAGGEVLINFDTSYKDNDSGSSPNSVFVSMPGSTLIRGKKVLSGENIETNRTNFTILEDGWQIDNNGCLCLTTDYYVDPKTSCAAPEPGDYDKPYKTLQAAVNAVVSANEKKSGNEYTIYVLNNIKGTGAASEITDNSLASIKSDSNELKLKIIPFGDAPVDIDAAKASRIFYISGNVKIGLENLNIYGGAVSGENGGAIYLDGTKGAELTLENCTVGKSNAQIESLLDGVQNKTYSPDETNCSNCADEGGGIYAAAGASLTLNSTKVLDCFAKSSSGGGGGIFLDSSYLSIEENSDILANGAAGSNGAAICSKKSEIYFTKGVVRHNYAKEEVLAAVPGIYLSNSTLDMYDGEIRDNYYPKGNFGSGIYIDGTSSSVSLYGGSVINNSSVAENVQNCDIGYSVSVADPVVSLAENAYIETIYSPKTYIKILDKLSAFSSGKECKIFTSIAEGNQVLRAETKDIPLADYVDFFKLYDQNMKEAKEYSLSVDFNAEVPAAKIVKTGVPFDSISKTSDMKQGESYAISTAEDLKKISSFSESSNFFDIKLVLKNDIDLGCDESSPFSPIGSKIDFLGTFDGNGHKISNLYVNTTTGKAGLFACVNSGTVKNITVEGTVIDNASSTTNGAGVAGVVGYSTGKVIIENCVSKVNITSSCENTGGILGYTNSDSVIRNCINIGNINSSKDFTGGILGFAVGGAVVYNCANFGTVSGKSYVGGIVGKTESDVSLCYSVGAITAYDGDSAAASIANVTGTDSKFYQYCYYKTDSAGAAFNGASPTVRNFSKPEDINLGQELSNRINDSKNKEFCSPWNKIYAFDGVGYPVCVQIR